MQEVEFRAFPKIERFNNQVMAITQKLHGTNAQITISGSKVFAGSRSRFLTVEDDNFGFAKFVEENKDKILSTLPEGTHYGEWCGPGINSGEGLKEKGLYLFNHWKFKDSELPPHFYTVPVLYSGKFEYSKIEETKKLLKDNGSQLIPGFMNVEGIVIQIGDRLYKDVFDQEETGWILKKERPPSSSLPDISHLLQPIRLEKLLSRDERYTLNYPKSLSEIVSEYVKDLIEEKQILGAEDEVKLIKKALGKALFSFVKETLECKK